jgi:alkylhydroperoxidase family enzyme
MPPRQSLSIYLQEGNSHLIPRRGEDAMTAGPQESRVKLLPVEEAKTRGREAGVSSSMSHLNIYRALLNHPELAGATAAQLSMLLWKANRLDNRLRELIIMRIAWRTGSVYEWTQHWHVAQRIGISGADILSVRDWRNAGTLDAAAKAVLAATDETLDRGRISDETWRVCAQHVGGEAELMEMVVAIGNWRTFSEVLRSLNIPLEDGVAAWPPDGLVPPSAIP